MWLLKILYFICAVSGIISSGLFLSNLISDITTKEASNSEREISAKFRLVMLAIMGLSWGVLIAF